MATTIECPVCGMTYTGKQCPVCGAKVKIRYRQQAQAQAQMQPVPEPMPYEEPQPTVTTVQNMQQRQQAKRSQARALPAVIAAIGVIFASSIAGFLGVANRARQSYQDYGYTYEYTIDEDMTDYGIEPQVVYDENGVKVVIEDFATNDYMTEIHFHLYNENDYPVRISSELATIDGVASTAWLYTMVDAYGEVDDVISIFDSNLEAMGLDAVHEFAFQLHVRNDDTYEDLGLSDRIVFKTPIAGTAQYTAPEGTVIYEGNGVRVTQVETMVEEDSFRMRYYVENDSDRNITVFSDDLLVNGKEVESSYVYGPEIPAGSAGYIEAVVYDYSRTVRSVSGTVFLKEYETWDDIDQFEIDY